MKKTSSFIIIIILFQTFYSFANEGKCQGKFLNPITEVCWSCLFPITIGSIPIAPSSKYKDTENPLIPICACKRPGIPLPLPGITGGFWEPIRIVEITRTPYCLVNFGGIKIMSSKNHGGFKKIRSEEDKRSKAYYHIHYYMYPLLAILNLISDLACMSMGSYDLAYMSELDPSHNNDSLANFMHPETFLLSNPIAKVACSVDCVKATATKLPIDSLFWCSGCQGSLYPFTGNVESHIGGVQTSTLLAVKQIAKLHRIGLARKTMTTSAAINGELCSSSYSYRIPKSQYRLQMTYPRANATGSYACNTIGLSDVLYSSGREFPYKGEDFAYLLWRKKNCCIL